MSRLALLPALLLVGCAARGDHVPRDDAAAAAFATPAPAPAPTSRLRAEPAELDLGTVARGATAAGVLRLRNPGPRAVRVLHVVPGCACVVVQGWDRDLAPGATGAVRLALRSGAMTGDLRKLVRVVTDEGPGAGLDVRVVARVPRD